MRRDAIYPVCLVLTLLISGCASGPDRPTVDYKSDYDFQKIRTIAFLPPSAPSSGDSPRVLLSDMVVDRVNRGLIHALEQKGYEFLDTADKADAMITWHLVTQQKTDIRTYNTGPVYGGYYGGYRGYNRMAVYNCWNCGTDVRVRQYTQGTYIVDIIDPTLKQSVWRAVLESTLKGEPSRNQEDYNSAAERILAGFPPY